MRKRYKRKRSGWMRRTSRICLNKTVNKSKLDTLRNFLILYQLVVNYCIVKLWSAHDTDKRD